MNDQVLFKGFLPKTARKDFTDDHNNQYYLITCPACNKSYNLMEIPGFTLEGRKVDCVDEVNCCCVFTVVL